MDKQELDRLVFDVTGLMMANRSQDALTLLEPHRDDPDADALYDEVQKSITTGTDFFESKIVKNLSQTKMKQPQKPLRLIGGSIGEFLGPGGSDQKPMLIMMSIFSIFAIAILLAFVSEISGGDNRGEIVVAVLGVVGYIFIWIVFMPRWTRLIEAFILHTFKRKFAQNGSMLVQRGIDPESWVVDTSLLGKAIRLLVELLRFVGVVVGIAIFLGIIFALR